MLKIKNLKEIKGPEANKLGLSFEDILEVMDDDKRFDSFMKQLERLSSLKTPGFRKKVLSLFLNLEDFTNICKDNFFITPSRDMYKKYNQLICIKLLNEESEWHKKKWRLDPTFTNRPFQIFEYGESAKESNRWIKEIKKYKSIEEVKQYAQEEINRGKHSADMVGLWQQNLIYRFVNYHSSLIIQNKIEELNYEVPIRTNNKPGAIKEYNQLRDKLSAYHDTQDKYARSKSTPRFNISQGASSEEIDQMHRIWKDFNYTFHQSEWLLSNPEYVELIWKLFERIPGPWKQLHHIANNKNSFAKKLFVKYSEKDYNKLMNKMKKLQNKCS